MRREICGGRRALSVDPGPARWRADLDWPLATPRSKDTSPVQIDVKADPRALLSERRGWRRCWLEWCALRPPRSSTLHHQAPAPLASVRHRLAACLPAARGAALRRSRAPSRSHECLHIDCADRHGALAAERPAARSLPPRHLARVDAHPRTKQRTALAAARGDAARRSRRALARSHECPPPMAAQVLVRRAAQRTRVRPLPTGRAR